MATPDAGKTQNEEPEMEKYAVACNCATGIRPKEEEMTKLADGTFRCPHCGRWHAQSTS